MRPPRRSFVVLVSQCSITIILQLAVVVYIALLLNRREKAYIKRTETAVSLKLSRYLSENFDALSFRNRRNAAFFGIHNTILSRADFSTMLDLSNDVTADQVEAYEYIARLTPSDISTFNSFCAKEIISSCYLKQIVPEGNGSLILGPQTKFMPVPENREEYYAVLYLDPLSYAYSTAQNIMGFDLLSFPSGQEEISQFLAAGLDSTVTHRKHLVTPSPNLNSYGLVIGSVAQHIKPDSSLVTIGFAACVVRIETILNRAVEYIGFGRQNVDIIMFDTTKDGVANITANNQSLMFKDTTWRHEAWFSKDVKSYDSLEQITFLDRSYDIYFAFGHGYKVSLKSIASVLVPLVVALAFFLLNCIALLIRNLRQKRKIVLDGIRANQMLYFMNHEVRNPLNIIKGMVDYLLKILNDKPTPLEEFKFNLNIVARTCEFLEHIVSDIRVLQHLEENAVDFHVVRSPLRMVLEELVQAVGPKMEENKNVTLRLECCSDIFLNVDEFRLKQIMLNLLTNAMKYTKRGFIDVRAIRTSNAVIVSVKDTGVGISDKKKEKIFQACLHGEINDVGRHGQYGLGLYLVKTLSERMGWSVSFISELKRGSTFSLTIPTSSKLLSSVEQEQQQLD